MKALILAAGYATRLWPLTLNTPKPLLPIGKNSILGYIIERLKAVKGIGGIFIITNSKFVKNFKEWKRAYKGEKQKISVIDDGMDTLKKRRGAIGDIIFAIEEEGVGSDIIVIAGDNIFDFALDDFVEKSVSNSSSVTVGLFDVKSLALAKKYGVVELNENSKVISFEEKPKEPKSTLAAMCLYYFPKEKLPLFKKYQLEGNPLDLAGSFIGWLSKREDVYGYIFKGRWLDIGDKRSLEKAQGISWN